jgi:hypothetical protein
MTYLVALLIVGFVLGLWHQSRLASSRDPSIV